MAKKKVTPPPAPVEPDSFSFETFRKLNSWFQKQHESNTPGCFNGRVSIHKYKVTVELIEEPNEVLAERLQTLWDECDNWHSWEPLRAAANAINYELQGNAGNKRQK